MKSKNNTNKGDSKKFQLSVKNKKRLISSLVILATIIVFIVYITSNILHNTKKTEIKSTIKPILETRSITVTPTATITPTTAPSKAVKTTQKRAVKKTTNTSRDGFSLDRTRQIDSQLSDEEILSKYNIVESGIFNVTEYTASLEECGKTDGITASGIKVQEWNTVAMGRKYKFGTKIYIPYFKDYPNHGIFTVHDRGGAIHNDNIDVYVETKSQAYRFGRQNLEVYIIEEKE